MEENEGWAERWRDPCPLTKTMYQSIERPICEICSNVRSPRRIMKPFVFMYFQLIMHTNRCMCTKFKLNLNLNLNLSLSLCHSCFFFFCWIHCASFFFFFLRRRWCNYYYYFILFFFYFLLFFIIWRFLLFSFFGDWWQLKCWLRIYINIL